MSKIVLTHIRNDIPAYIEYTLNQYKITNADAVIDFLCNRELISEKNIKLLEDFGVNVVDVSSYNGDELLNKFLDVCYLNKNLSYAPKTTYPSQPYFWQSGVERLFYILAHMKRQNYENVFHFENDNLVYYDVKSINKDLFSKEKITVSKMSDICSLTSTLYIPNYQALHTVCERINELFAIPEQDLLSSCQCQMIHEMTLLSICAKEGLVEHFDSIPPSKGDYLFDGLGYGSYICGTNNFQPAGYYTTEFNNVIGCKIRDAEIFPYYDYSLKAPLVKDKQGQIHKIFNLHVHNKNLKQYISI